MIQSTMQQPQENEDFIESQVRQIETALRSASRKIAPLWPLKSFVAVNPFLGLLDQHFAKATQLMYSTAGAKMTMPRSFYLEAIQTGRVTDEDLEDAIFRARKSLQTAKIYSDVKSFKNLAFSSQKSQGSLWLTLADVANQLTGQDWSEFVTSRISAWAADFFDEGQALFRSPWQGGGIYEAWKAEAEIDRSPEVMGIKNFRRTVRSLPTNAMETIIELVSKLDIPKNGLEAYFHRLLMTIGGWSSYARYLSWNSELKGQSNEAPIELLAIRLAWEWALLQGVAGLSTSAAWTKAKTSYGDTEGSQENEAIEINSILQDAYERSWQKALLSQLATTTSLDAKTSRPSVQAVFCIDVRSEVFRRALEGVDSGIETIGFAGFFGFPIEYVRLGDTHGTAQCPVLLNPAFTICEGISGSAEGNTVASLRYIRRKVMKAWKTFKLGAISCFGFVGPIGFLYAPKLLTDSLGFTRAVPRPVTWGIDRRTQSKLHPEISPGIMDGHKTGLTLEQKIHAAAGALRGMSLRNNFARLILIAGHGSNTVNNAHAAGLDCGACGGNTGEANARVAAAVLNDPEVRLGLRKKGLEIPEDTFFLAALHDTTTDMITIYDEEQLPISHTDDFAQLKKSLLKAGSLARRERAKRLFIASKEDVDRAIIARSRDWSQVRPEWGLAGCAAFIAAPRSRTRGLDLKGRPFLHTYHWKEDEDFSILELIMTAPMVVASWINLQYYGSTVDNRVFGSGNKVLHNVTGTIGVLEGNGGDLRPGLSWQSIHDGQALAHEPLRLSVIIEAPIDAINNIVSRNESVRHLLDNQWIHLFAMNESGQISQRYVGNLVWEPV